jgi:hypothetical protein
VSAREGSPGGGEQGRAEREGRRPEEGRATAAHGGREGGGRREKAVSRELGGHGMGEEERGGSARGRERWEEGERVIESGEGILQISKLKCVSS